VINIPFDMPLPELEFGTPGVMVSVGATESGQVVPARLTVGSITVSSADVNNVLHGTLPGNSITVTGALNIVASGKLKRTGAGALRVSSLEIHTSGQLDLTDTSLIVDYTGSSPLNTVRALLSTGSAARTWTGNGVISSTAAAVAADSSKPFKTGLAYTEASALGLITFAAEPVDATAIIVAYTYYGDANLDGVVDVADLGILASHWQAAGAWSAGDFDYSGFVNVADLGLLASNWQAGTSLSPAPPNAVATALAGLGLPSVPEPTSLLVLVLVRIVGTRPRRTR
jgi:hypothetical protein